MSLRSLAVGALLAGASAGALECARRQGPSARPGPAATSAGPQSLRFTSGLYRMTTRGPHGVGRGEIKLRREGDSVRVMEPDDSERPGEGRVDGNCFTLRAGDENGDVLMTGEIRENDVVEGTLVLTRAGGGPARELSFRMERIGPVDAPWSRKPSSFGR